MSGTSCSNTFSSLEECTAYFVSLGLGPDEQDVEKFIARPYVEQQNVIQVRLGWYSEAERREALSLNFMTCAKKFNDLARYINHIGDPYREESLTACTISGVLDTKEISRDPSQRAKKWLTAAIDAMGIKLFLVDSEILVNQNMTVMVTQLMILLKQAMGNFRKLLTTIEAPDVSEELIFRELKDAKTLFAQVRHDLFLALQEIRLCIRKTQFALQRNHTFLDGVKLDQVWPQQIDLKTAPVPTLVIPDRYRVSKSNTSRPAPPMITGANMQPIGKRPERSRSLRLDAPPLVSRMSYGGMKSPSAGLRSPGSGHPDRLRPSHGQSRHGRRPASISFSSAHLTDPIWDHLLAGGRQKPAAAAATTATTSRETPKSSSSTSETPRSTEDMANDFLNQLSKEFEDQMSSLGLVTPAGPVHPGLSSAPAAGTTAHGLLTTFGTGLSASGTPMAATTPPGDMRIPTSTYRPERQADSGSPKGLFSYHDVPDQ